MCVSAIAITLSLSFSTVNAQEKIKFPIGVGTKTVGTHMFWLAAKKGFFEEFGLDVQPVLLRGTSITIQALVGESLYLALGSADATIGNAPSTDLIAVSGVVGGLTQAIVAAKRYKAIKELRGSTIGVQVLTSGATNVLKRILNKTDWNFRRTTNCFPVGGGSFNLAALTSGQIGATYLVVPLDADCRNSRDSTCWVICAMPFPTINCR
jgi:ABC-type nitrate/sulfonate/bicarbonate transport system substrate-binding protein